MMEVLFMACLSGSNLEQMSMPMHGVGILRLGTLNFGDVNNNAMIYNFRFIAPRAEALDHSFSIVKPSTSVVPG